LIVELFNQNLYYIKEQPHNLIKISKSTENWKKMMIIKLQRIRYNDMYVPLQEAFVSTINWNKTLQAIGTICPMIGLVALDGESSSHIEIPNFGHY
jgi:hypothetical protein